MGVTARTTTPCYIIVIIIIVIIILFLGVEDNFQFSTLGCHGGGGANRTQVQAILPAEPFFQALGFLIFGFFFGGVVIVVLFCFI